MKEPSERVFPPIAGRRIVLGVTGGIAAYKTVGLSRSLTVAGAEVDVVATRAALEFVRPLSFEALTGRRVYTRAYEPGDPLLHIRLAGEADLVIIAPATADFIARVAAGMADDLLSTILLATRAPVLICPAMNDRMFAHPQTKSNLERLEKLGHHIFGPTEGPLAWGEGEGRGRMEEAAAIFTEAARLLAGDSTLAGLRILVTAGPTREPIDPVRFIGNRSSGRMGYALAGVGRRLGGQVTLISGPSALQPPTGVDLVQVETAAQMHEAVEARLSDADVFIMAAAVADYRPSTVAAEKIKKSASIELHHIDLDRTADILKSTKSSRKKSAIVVGFALETENAVENGVRKMTDKDLDIIVVNNARDEGAGFEVPTNRVTIVDRAGTTEQLPLLTKEEVAERILQRVVDLIQAS